ncbi:MAG: NYN domain-containing protein [bacterium]
MKKQSDQKKYKNESLLRAASNARIFIDAYNFIFQDPVLSKQPVLEQARDMLRMLCSQYHESYPGHIIYLVFDGDSSVGLIPEKSKNQILNEKHGIREVYTQSGETADDWIVNLTAHIFPPDNLFVVTGDIELSNAVVAHGVKAIPPEKFFKKTHKSRKSRQKSQGLDHSSSPGSQSVEQVSISPNKARKIKDELRELFADQLDEPVSF